MKTTIENPYARRPGAKYVCLKGNLHTHSTRSDGIRKPQELVDTYAGFGHNFFTFSDHDRLSDHTGLNSRGMVLLPGNEISLRGVHLLDIGARTMIMPDADRQKVIDRINKKSGFAIVNHPNWTEGFNHCTFEQLMQLKNYCGIEILNGGCLFDPGSGYSLDKWDRLLSAGRFVWGFANDDSHGPDSENLAWNVVQIPAGRVNAAAIIKALRSGNFYASSGVTLDRIELRGTVLHMEARNAKAFEVIGDHGAGLAFIKGKKLCFDLKNVNASYVRVTVYGAPRQYAWTQPFRIHGPAEHRKKLLDARPLFRVLRLKSADIPDMDSGVWKKAPNHALKYGKGAREASVKTNVRAILTEKHLVFRAECEEPNLSQLKYDASGKGTQLWTEDSVELFLDIEKPGTGYFQAIVNPLGAVRVYHTKNSKAHPRFTSIAKKGGTGWTVLLALELSSLGINKRLRPGQRWGFHIARNRRAGANETLFWKWTGGQNHRPDLFGWLRF